MVDVIHNTYFVGQGQPYATANQAIQEIAFALQGGDFELPSEDLPDGGQVNVMFVGGGSYSPIKFPDNMTEPLKDNGRSLLIRRQEFLENGTVVSDNLPIISASAPGTVDLPLEDRVIGINIGDNNPNVKIQGIRVEGFVIGLSAGFNCHNLHIQRNFITNCTNAQIYIHDCEQVYIINNIVVGGQYGIVAKFIRKLRVYHNTVFLDGLAAIDNETKAGMMLQGERTFGSSSFSTVYSLGNLVYTIGCPAVVYYDEDIKEDKLVSNYNDFYSPDSPLVQVRQDAATLPDEAEVIKAEFFTLDGWRNEGIIPNVVDLFNQPVGLDANSISTHPVFINVIDVAFFSPTSILDLTLINNSPILGLVPSWFDVNDVNYVPTDLSNALIAKDSLLNNREKPFTAIGANDAPSVNGFFGQDIFTSPLGNDPTANCNIDPLVTIARQNVEMIYPKILPGYFHSNERRYYLYGKKGAFQLGFLAKSTFRTPGFLEPMREMTVKARGEVLPDEDWDLIGHDFIVYHRANGLLSFDDEVEIEGWIKNWSETVDNAYGFTFKRAYYVFKIRDGDIDYALPDDFVSSGPVVITDDRVSYRDPIEIVRRDFTINFNASRGESTIEFLGTRNVLDNSQFDISPNGIAPQDWFFGRDTNAYMLGPDFAYAGERAVALGVDGGSPGAITSKRLPVLSGEYLTMSWHSMLPFGVLTGGVNSTIFAATDVTTRYNIDYYDHADNYLTGYSLSGSFDVNNDYQRYYLTLTPNDTAIYENISNPTNINLLNLDTGFLTIPNGARELDFTVTATNHPWTGGFIALDAMQAEYFRVPTPYHQMPSLNNMTVEYESSGGAFIDRRMNLTPFFNENPNGFLYITDLPARIWGGPEDLEVTTLHEYRWPEGRLFHLPWARLYGKDKLTYRSLESPSPLEPHSIIEPFNLPKRAIAINSTPSTIRLVQDSKVPEGLTAEVIDEAGNPFSLRNYTMSVFEPNDNFPGYLCKRKLGAKEQLGTTIFGQLNEHGSAVAQYVTPPSSAIRFVGTVPNPLETQADLSGMGQDISFINTSYNVSLENNGNITVIGSGGTFHNLQSEDFITGSLLAMANTDQTAFLPLDFPPVFGSVEVRSDGELLNETFGLPQAGEYVVNYPFGQLELSNGYPLDVPLHVRYQPKFAYPDPNEQTTIIFHHTKVFGQYTGPIQVDYDAEIFLEVTAQQALTGEIVNTFPVVAQNPQLSRINNDSPSLEY